MICKECNREFETRKGLHGHIKAHKMSVEKYYHTHEPRFDLYDNNLIKFKDYDQYISSSFNSHANELCWFFKTNHPDRTSYFINNIVEFGKRKGYMPSECELMSKKGLCISHWMKVFPNLEYSLIGHNSNIPFRLKHEGKALEKEKSVFKIFIDPREQKPFPLLEHMFESVETMKLNVGDYTVAGDAFCDVFVERKSLDDFIGTLSGGIDRFKREVQRAKDMGHYLVVLVEADFNQVLNYRPKKHYGQKVGGAFVMHKMREVISSFDNIQFFFPTDHVEACSLYMKDIFELGSQVKTNDLQLIFNLNGRLIEC